MACYDNTQPIGIISTVYDDYVSLLETIHSQTDEEDWAALNETAELTNKIKRPDSFEGSEFGNFVLLKLGVLSPYNRYTKAAETFDSDIATIINEAAFIDSSIPRESVEADDPFFSYATSEAASGVGPIASDYSLDTSSTQDIQQLVSLYAPANDAVQKVLNFIIEFDGLTADLPCPPNLEDYLRINYQILIAEYFKRQVLKENEAFAADVPITDDEIMAARAGADIFGVGETQLLQALDDRALRLFADLDDEAKNIFAEIKLYQEQCFVLSQLANLIEYKKTSPSLLPRLPYIESVVSYKESTDSTEQFKQTEIITADANAPILIQDEPFGFMNKMVQYPSTSRLFNLTTAQLSSLVPTIRLYKIETDPDTGKDIGSTEIKFDPNPAVKSYQGERSSLDLFMRKGKRGYGVGLKNFNFTFHGSDPFAVKKAIKADLTLFATSFGDLITERDGYKFADLALRTGKTPEDLRQNLDIIDQQNLDKLNFRLKVVVGWAIPHKNVNQFNSSEKDAVKNSFVTLNLTPTTHEFNFDEMGGVNFKINYLAYIEDYFNNQTFNIFSDPKLEATREARKLFYEFLGTQNCDVKSLDAIKETDAKILQNEKARSFSTILKKLRRQEKLLTYNLSYDEVSKFLRGFKIDNEKLVPKTYDATSTQAIQRAFKTFNGATPDNERGRVSSLTSAVQKVSNQTVADNSISFFFISDLLSVIMQGIDESLREMTETQKELDFKSMIENQGVYSASDASQVLSKLNIKDKQYKRFLNERAGKERKQSLLRAKAQFEKLRLVLGPVEIRDPFDSEKVQFCSLGDIPLSLNYFTEFLTKKMIGRDEIYYPLTNFVKDLVNEVIKNFLNNDGCFDFGIRQKLKLNSTTITAYNRTENKFHSGAGYEIAESEFAEGQVPIDDITYFIANNTISKNEPDYGFGNVLDLSRAPIKPVLQISGPSRLPISNPPIEREMNYYIFYAGRSYPTDLMTGNEAVDAANGIFHYVLGKDRGIVKNISLDRTDMKGMKELRFEKEGFDGLTQLREVYNANIDCLLNVHALPGSYIYIDPRGFSPEAGINYSQFGIGGYYMITRAEHSIGVGKADTKIIAKWVADTNGRIEAGDNDASDNSKVVERNPKSNTTRKCISQYRKPKPRVNSKAVEEINKRSGGTGYLYGAPGRKA